MSSKAVAVKSPRKLIEVALPLDKISAASSHEKSIRFGHPSTLHLWWSRKPLAAARAVLFAQLVNDPGYERHLNRGIKKVEAAKERERLFKIIEDLVVWENTNNEEVLGRARAEILRSWRETCELNRNHPDAATLFDPDELPAFHDPFAGGGAIPLEAQRLGLKSYASDLNPVAVTINKAMVEIPPRFAGRIPVGPLPPGERDPKLSRKDWPGATGLAEDVRRYGAWVRAEAEQRIGHLYPPFLVTKETTNGRSDLLPHIGKSLPVLAYLWVKTVLSPNPAYSNIHVPLASTFQLTTQAGKEAYVQPIVTGRDYTLEVRIGACPDNLKLGTTAGKRQAFRCLLSGTPIDYKYIRNEGQANRLGNRLLAVVLDGPKGRIYMTPSNEQMESASKVKLEWQPNLALPDNPRDFKTPNYGIENFSGLFLPRQTVHLDVLSSLVVEAIEHCKRDYATCSHDIAVISDPQCAQALEYWDGVGVYLALAVGKVADYGSANTSWSVSRGQARNTFVRQAIPMMWGTAEVNPFVGAAGDWSVSLEGIVRSIKEVGKPGCALQHDAQTQQISRNKVVSTDPPYFDNIGYAELSDFFYIWLRRSLRHVLPSLFSTISTPKSEEMFALSSRYPDKSSAEQQFMVSMRLALTKLHDLTHPAFPITIYYAYKQGDQEGVDLSSSGWETILAALISSGLAIVGTWPMRTERTSRSSGIGTNALASSIVLVCRKRETDIATISRAQFIRELRTTLPEALIEMTRGGENSPVAPVDLSQAILGPGMGIFSRYEAVLEADGTPMSVKTALQLINRFLADDDFDPETQFCLQWFETNYWKEGLYGQADVAARAKGTGVDALARAGVLRSGGGKVQLLRPADFADGWCPERGNQTPVWEGLHHLIHALNKHGEQAAGRLLAMMPNVSGPARTLSYRLYTLCERQKLAEDARTYNELIGAWAAIEVAAQEHGYVETQADLFQR